MKTAGSQPKHVAHVLPFRTVGGTEVGTLRVAEAGREHGFRSTIFCPAGADAVRSLFTGSGLETAEYEQVEPSYRRPRGFLAASYRLAREFRRRGVDLVHCADVPAAMFVGYAARLARLPLLCHVRNRYAEMSRRDRSFLLPVSRFVFVSRDTWGHFALRVPARRGAVLYDGYELDTRPNGRDAASAGASVRQEFGIPEGVPIVGMVARVARQKDYPTLVRAASRVTAVHPGARFLIVGDNSGAEVVREHYEMVSEMVRAAGLEQNFVFTGHRQDVARLIDAMDLFVLSTHWEGLPLVILEAMAHEKPVIATGVDGVPEVIEDGVTGLLFPHEDHSLLAEHLLGLIADPGRACSLAAAARERLRTQFSPHRFAADLAGLYREALACERPAGQAAAC